MFNFNEVFNEYDKQEIPDALLNFYSSSLPDDLEYKAINSHLCHIVPKADSMNISVNVDLSKIDKVSDINGFFEYLYRTQTEYIVSNNIEDEIKINNQKFKIKDIFKCLGATEFTEGQLVIKPHPFPKPFNVKVEFDKYLMNFTVERQPNDDFEKSYFKSNYINNICMSYVVDEKLHTVNFSFEFKFEDITDLVDIEKMYCLYHSMKNGLLKIEGENINKDSGHFNDKSNIFNFLESWHKVYKLSKILSIEFKFSKNLTTSDVIKVNELYTTLIEDREYKTFRDVNSLTVAFDRPTDLNKLKSKNGVDLCFANPTKYMLFKKEFIVYTINFWFDLKVSDIKEIHKENYKYQLNVQSTKDTGIFTITKHFINKSDLKKYYEENHNNLETLYSIDNTIKIE